MNETAISKEIVDALSKLGILAIRSNSGAVAVKGGYMYLAPSGWPDITVYQDSGKVLFVEVKKPKGIVSDSQTQRHEQLRALGYEVMVAYSVRDVIERLGIE